jgi:hypothetical protein
VQERILRDGLYAWRVLVLCALLNRTGRRQVRPMFEALLVAFPTPQRMARGRARLERMLRPLGLGARRSALLRRLSADYVSGRPASQCFGVGQYARDALAIFVEGRTDVRPSDKFLGRYLRWIKRRKTTA